MTISARPIVPLPLLTYQDVEQKYGPQTVELVALLTRDSVLSDEEVWQLDATWDAIRYDEWDAARSACRYVIWCNAGDADTLPDARAILRLHAARSASWDVTLALTLRDLVGTNGFTQNHYDTLTLPWRLTIGPIHPDDTQLTPKQRELGLLMFPTWEHTATDLIETLLVLN